MNLIDNLIEKTPLWLYCRLVNLRAFLKNKAHRVYPVKDHHGKKLGIHEVRVGKEVIFLCRRGRNNMHKHGIQHRIDSLAKAYLLDHIENLTSGTLIDCGANIGELGIWAKQKNLTYIPFEPENVEAECCDRNNFNGEKQTNRYALWKKDEYLRFYNRASSADSSLLPSGLDDQYTEIEAKSLDNILLGIKLISPVIFKVEAEGAEPEIIEGSKNILKSIDFITVDCGYERGDHKNPEHTFIEVNNILAENDFKVIAANLRRGTFLFKNMNTKL